MKKENLFMKKDKPLIENIERGKKRLKNSEKKENPPFKSLR